ncbi:hypothetical protein [Streptomyces sp. NPDC042319]|uniref:hypothetical protein n=1 Tax=Streptomyces sp. NPDC042319 TaxID=3154332 RepID=UPI0033D5B88F
MVNRTASFGAGRAACAVGASRSVGAAYGKSTEAIVGTVTGSLHRSGTLLLSRLDETNACATPAARQLPPPATWPQLSPAGPAHPWADRTFSAGRDRGDALDVTLVVPELVAEISSDVALDGACRQWHPSGSSVPVAISTRSACRGW